jgi:hypothetical protein
MRRTTSALVILLASTAFAMAADSGKANEKKSKEMTEGDAKAKQSKQSENAKPRMKIPAADKPHDQKTRN